MPTPARSFRAAACFAVIVAAAPAAAQQSGDVFDQFFRFADTEHRATFQEAPGETVDPFTGNLLIVQEDLFLPGVAGHDLRIVRKYSSKIWAQADLATSLETLLVEGDRSVLGYGWSMHMGRLLNPLVDPAYTISADACSPIEFPVFEAPDGSTHVFYPTSESTALNPVFRSKGFWQLDVNCAVLGANQGACIWTDTGLRYELSTAPGNPFWIGTRLTWPVSAIVDPFGNRISISYQASTGAAHVIVDSYSRVVQFFYDADGMLQTMRVGDASSGTRDYDYFYDTYTSARTGGPGRFSLPGNRKFLKEVRPPTGGSYLYEYGFAETVSRNQYALKRVTYPHGGTTSYVYEPVPFFTGRDTVSFPVVTRRTVAGRGIPVSTWSFAYSSPPPSCGIAGKCSVDPSTDPAAAGTTNLHVTTITRPDQLVDTFKIVGFGHVADRATALERLTYGVGLTIEEAHGNRAQVVSMYWDHHQPAISPAPYSAAIYAGNCGPYVVWDSHVSAPRLIFRRVSIDAATFDTAYADFDAYAQPRTVIESGTTGDVKLPGEPDDRPPTPTRTTSWTYFVDEAAHMLRGRALSQRVCVEAECYGNSWTYDPGPGRARDSEVLSGVATHFAYHATGDLRSVTNALFETLTLSDYRYGVARRVDLNGVYQVKRTATFDGRVATETDGRGIGFTTTYDYDAIGRPKRVKPPGDSDPTEYSYTPGGRPDGEAILVTRGAYTHLSSLDGLGRVVATEDSEGVRTQNVFDAMRNLVFRSYPYDDDVVVGDLLEYEALGRVTTITKASRLNDGSARTCELDGRCVATKYYSGNCTQTMVERGLADWTATWHCSTSYGDPQEKRPYSVSDGAAIWRYTHSAAGKLRTVTAPGSAQPSREYTYDWRQFLATERTAESGTVTYGRNAIGQMTSRTDARRVTATYVYEDRKLGRLSEIDWGTNDDIKGRQYDNANNLTHVQSVSGGTFDFDWDQRNRPRSQDWTYRGVPYRTAYTYRPGGCPQTITYPTGTQLTFECDTRNRVTGITLTRLGGVPRRIVDVMKYHASGQPESYSFGNGRSTTCSYDDRARLTALNAPGIVHLKYGYDGADNVTSFEDALRAGSPRLMTYDRQDRLWTVFAPAQWGTLSYAYDGVGNVTTVARSDAWATSYVYDAATNRLASSESSGPNPSPRTLIWDAPGHLATSLVGGAWTTYRYDHAGRRVEKSDGSGTTIYHHDASGRVIAETTAEGVKLRDYVYLGNKLVAVDGCITGAPPSCTETEWYHTDALGSVVARTNLAGTVTAQFDYQPFGERWSAPGLVAGTDGDRQYNGRVFDAGTGFHDYGARLYWPEIGRFVSADSYGGNIADPASLNRYSYVKNNPYKYTDPTGHFAFLAIPAICAAGACEAIASAALATAAVIGIVAVADVAVHSDATLLPDSAWDKKAPHPKYDTHGPPKETIDWERYNPKTGELEESTVTYDEAGRQTVRTDYTTHNKKDHGNPHHHKTKYGPGKEKGEEVREKGPAPGHPPVPKSERKPPEAPKEGG